jgi:hypothetical protein
MENLSNFEREQIIGVCLTGSSLTKTAILLCVLQATDSKVMSAYINHWKTTSAKKNSREKLTERDRHTLGRTVLKNHTITAAQVTEELNIHLEATVSTKTVQHELHRSNIHGRAAISEPFITESNAQMCK